MPRFAVAALMACLAAPCATAQYQQAPEPSLGDLARDMRKKRQSEQQEGLAGPKKVFTNETLKDLNSSGDLDKLPPLLDGPLADMNRLKLSSMTPPINEISCSCSYSAKPFGDLTASSEKLPEGEVPKLEGNASYNGSELKVQLYNGTKWDLRELTVKFEVVQRITREPAPADRGAFGESQPTPEGKGGNGDEPKAEPLVELSRVYRLKGAAESYTNGQFKQEVGVKLSREQDWRWRIVEAKGIPPGK